MSFPSSQLFIGHLHPDTSHKDFERRFGKYGNMKRCEIKKGFGFIEYEDIRDAEDAIKDEHDTTFQGNRIVVEWAKGSSRFQGRTQDRYQRSSDRGRYRGRDERDRDERDRDRKRR
ncbi:hypothetical protein MXB_1934 [Myxobolus squamalis]|nr:hypothetical protein MXB_1934 [Myxobolus squamalis]